MGFGDILIFSTFKQNLRLKVIKDKKFYKIGFVIDTEKYNKDKKYYSVSNTYWNNNEAEYNPHSFDSVSYEQLSISPDANSYTPMENNYYMPKVEV